MLIKERPTDLHKEWGFEETCLLISIYGAGKEVTSCLDKVTNAIVNQKLCLDMRLGSVGNNSKLCSLRNSIFNGAYSQKNHFRIAMIVI